MLHPKARVHTDFLILHLLVFAVVVVLVALAVVPAALFGLAVG